MSLGNLDLNLIRALDALLREANVTRAAERLNLTQPTVSASLARLRKHFDDELLRRSGNQLELTPLAVRLRPLVAEALTSAERLFTAHADIDPAQSTRRFSIVTSDYGLGVVGARWSGQLSAAAPHARVALRAVGVEALTPPEVRARDFDGLLAPHGFLASEFPHVDLFQDRWVIIADEHNEAIGPTPSLSDIARLPWATAFEGPRAVPTGLHPGEWAVIAARVQVVVDSFALLPLCVLGTSRLALVQERLIDALGARAGLRVLPPPFPVDPIVLAFWWHPAYELDPEHIWMRTLLTRLCDVD